MFREIGFLNERFDREIRFLIDYFGGGLYCIIRGFDPEDTIYTGDWKNTWEYAHQQCWLVGVSSCVEIINKLEHNGCVW